MVFSSPIFLFLFLPAVLAGHLLLPRAVRNGWLLVASLLFYGWGEPYFLSVMLASIVGNHLLGLRIAAAPSPRARRGWLTLAVVLNIGFIAVFKYGAFVVKSANVLLELAGAGTLPVPSIPLPLGISFFTFVALSYVIDVARGDAEVQRNPFKTALYVTLFPHLIAGPIVRYGHIAGDLVSRRVTLERFAYGIERFVVGLAKKVLVANTVATAADGIWAVPVEELTTPLAWAGALAYTVQIYFDFSGYSDMAIGMAHMLGFHFRENFLYPYAARSVRDFWRRWHISLSSWFRDYLYIPLGGNRGSRLRTAFNLVLVFFLCGLWHGASWTFVVWGLYHGGFLVLERTRFGRFVDALPAPLAHAYTLLVAIVGWVLFRSETFAHAAAVLMAMMGIAGGSPQLQPIAYYLTTDVVMALVVGAVGSAPLFPALGAHAGRRGSVPSLVTRLELARVPALLGLLLLCAVRLSAQTHNPFIYFRF